MPVSGISHGAIASARGTPTSEDPYRKASGTPSLPTNMRAQTNGSAATDSVCSPRASPLPRKPLMTPGKAQAAVATTTPVATAAPNAPLSQARWLSARAITAGQTLSPPPMARIAPAATGTASARRPAIAASVGIES